MVLSLDSEELSDTELSFEVFENGLTQALAALTLPSSYTKSLAEEFSDLPSSGRTAEQQSLYDLTRLFATYQVAYAVAISLPGRMMKSISDGKNIRTRFSPESVYRDTVKYLGDMLLSLKLKLENLGNDKITGFDYLNVIPPGTDRVTNS